MTQLKKAYDRGFARAMERFKVATARPPAPKLPTPKQVSPTVPKVRKPEPVLMPQMAPPPAMPTMPAPPLVPGMASAPAAGALPPKVSPLGTPIRVL